MNFCIINFASAEGHSHHVKKDCFIAEVTVTFRGGAVVHATEGTDSMYASIDLVAHKLARAIKKHNEKTKDKHKRERAEAKGTPYPEEMTSTDEEFNIDDLINDLDERYKENIKVS